MTDIELVEAVLFSASKPLKIGDISMAADMETQKVKDAMKKLMRSYRTRTTGLEIAKIGNKYALQVKEEYIRPTDEVAVKELPHEIIKTAALIAYYQPMKKKDLTNMIGAVAKPHVDELKKRKLITATRGKQGNIMLNTTQKFFEFFGLEMTKPEELKQMLAKKAGLK